MTTDLLAADGRPASYGVVLLGGVRWQGPDTDAPLTRLHDRRALAHLAVSLDQAVPIETLGNAVWDDELRPIRWRESLHNAIARLRHLANAAGIPSSIRSDGGTYQLQAAVGTDLEFVHHAIQRAGMAERSGDLNTAMDLLSDALHRSRNDPFADLGTHRQWHRQGEMWSDRRRSAVRSLCRIAVLTGKPARALTELDRPIQHDPHDEDLAVAHAIVLAAADRTDDAIDRLQQHAMLLAGVGREPSRAAGSVRTLLTTPRDQPLTLAALARTLDSPDLPSTTRPSRVIGRGSELARLRGLWTNVGLRTQVVHLSGPSQSGKTALLNHFVAELRRGRASAIHLRIGPTDHDQAALAQIVRPIIEAAYPGLDAICALHGSALHQLVPDLVPNSSPPWISKDRPPSPTQDSRTERVAATLAAMATHTSQEPLAVVIDDVQHLGPAGQDLLARAADGRIARGLLVLVGSHGGSITLPPSSTAIILGDLAEIDAVGLIERAGLNATPGGLELIRRTSGFSPGPLTSLLSHARAGESDLALAAERWLAHRTTKRFEHFGPVVRLVVDTLAVAAPCPDSTLHELLRSDLSRQAIDTSAQVIFELGLVEHSPSGLIEWTDPLVAKAIAQALPPIRRALLHLRIGESAEGITDTSSDPTDETNVSSTAVPDTPAPDTPAPNTASPNTPVPDRAHHLRLAGRYGLGRSQLPSALIAAAQRQRRRHRTRGIDLIAEALDLIEADLRADDGKRLPPADLLLRLAEAISAEEQDEHARTVWTRLERIISQSGHPGPQARVILSLRGNRWSGGDRFDATPIPILESLLHAIDPTDHAERAQLLVRLAWQLTTTGDSPRVAALRDRAVADAEQSGDPRIVGRVLADAADLVPPEYDLLSYGRLADRIIAIAHAVQDRDLEAAGLVHRATYVLRAGTDPGLDDLSRMVHRLDGQLHEAFAAPGVALIAALRGDLAEAERLLRSQLHEAAIREAAADLRFGLATQLIWVLGIQGRREEVREIATLLPRGDSPMRAIGSVDRRLRRGEPTAIAALDELLPQVPSLLDRFPAGRLPVAAEIAGMYIRAVHREGIEQMIHLLQPHAGLLCSAYVHVCVDSVNGVLGRLMLAAGRPRFAAFYLEAAAEQLHQLGAVTLLVPTLETLADAREQSGDDRASASLQRTAADLRRFSAGSPAAAFPQKLGGSPP